MGIALARGKINDAPGRATNAPEGMHHNQQEIEMHPKDSTA